MRAELSVSLFSADFLHVADDLEKINQSNAKTLHVDVMDGDFVELYGINQNWLEAVHEICPRKTDIHFMTNLSGERISSFLYDYVGTVTVHLEAAGSTQLCEYLDLIHSAGKRAGIALSPGTEAGQVIPFLEQADEVLVMTCEPGKRGSVYLPDMVQKIELLNQYKKNMHRNYRIAVDGGINPKTARDCMEAGADKVIIGRSFFQNPSMQMLFE